MIDIEIQTSITFSKTLCGEKKGKCNLEDKGIVTFVLYLKAKIKNIVPG